MPTIDLLPRGRRFYKANLHSHTVLSDGRLTKEETKALYSARGYSIVAYTDHRYYANHSELCDGGFLALAAYEADLNEKVGPDSPFRDPRTYHLNLYDTDPAKNAAQKQETPLPQVPYGDVAGINDYIRRMNELGFLVCYNHPYWSKQVFSDYGALQGLFAMEIYNHGCEHDGLFGFNPQTYDEMLRAGMRLSCLATDDNHNAHPVDDPLCDSFGGFTMIAAEALTYPAVIEALRRGDTYASMGPEIRALFIEGRRLVIECSPVEKIYVMTRRGRCYMQVAAPGETIDHAAFELTGQEGYFRVDCRDGKGLHACSNAYYPDALGL